MAKNNLIDLISGMETRIAKLESDNGIYKPCGGGTYNPLSSNAYDYFTTVEIVEAIVEYLGLKLRRVRATPAKAILEKNK